MKKYSCLISFTIFIILSAIILNINVSTQQCINLQCRSIRLPLYLKILNFFDRHYNYKTLVKTIIEDTTTEEEKVKKIFEWTYKNINRVPSGLPVIDDHIWYTIVRGYAANDQFSDIFSTLCNSIGIKAFFKKVYSKEGDRHIVLSFVRIRDYWSVFDPYNGIYFKDKDDRFCKMEFMGTNNCRPVHIEGKPRFDIDYTIYYDDILSTENFESLSRSSIQSPLSRFLFELKKLKK